MTEVNDVINTNYSSRLERGRIRTGSQVAPQEVEEVTVTIMVEMATATIMVEMATATIMAALEATATANVSSEAKVFHYSFFILTCYSDGEAGALTGKLIASVLKQALY